MKKFDFSEPTRQSSKGIIIIFAVSAFKFIKQFFVLFLGFGYSLSRKQVLEHININLIWLGFTLLVILLLGYAYLRYLNFKFYIGKDHFYLSNGIFNKEKISIPKSKIQNVHIRQNFIQQLINVVSLKIETAGDDKSEIEIHALDKTQASDLKSELFNSNSISVLEKQNLNKENKVFFKASIKRLLAEGLTQNHLRSFAILASFIFGLYYEFKDYLNSYNLENQLTEIEFKNRALEATFLMGFLITLIVLLVSLSFSVLKTIILNFNLEVIERKPNIEINKGLINKISLSLSPTRIQNLVVKTNRLKKYLGLYTLSVTQAMISVKQQKDLSIVALKHEQLEDLIKKLLSDYQFPNSLSKPNKYYIRILALKLIFVILIINIPVFAIFEEFLLWLNIVMLLIASIYVYISYKKAFYHFDEHFITIGSGFIDTTTNILQIHKIQTIQMKQSFFQKRRKIASLLISTASKTVTIPYIEEYVALKIYNFLLYKVESQTRDWM